MTDRDDLQQRVAALERQISGEPSEADGTPDATYRRGFVAALASVAGLGAIGQASAQTAAPGSACTWRGDQNAAGYRLAGLDAIEFDDGTVFDGDDVGGALGTPDHGDLGGLADDDHSQYLLADGTRALSADWDVGGQRISNASSVETDHVWFGQQADAPSDSEIGSGNTAVYSKDDENLYYKPHGGTETQLGSGGAYPVTSSSSYYWQLASKNATGGAGTYTDPYTGGAIGTTLSNAATQVGERPKEIVIDGAFQEAVDLTTAGASLTSPVWHARIAASGEDVIDVGEDDTLLRNLWARVNSGSVNGIHATGGTNSEEFFAENIEVEGGVTGLYLDMSRSVVRGFYGQAQDDFALRTVSGTNANRLSAIGATNTVAIQGQDHVAHGVVVQPANGNAVEEMGIFVGNNDNLVSGTVTGVGGASPNQGVRMNGNGNVFLGTSEGNNGTDLVVGTGLGGPGGNADNCVAIGRFGDVTFTSDASDCKVIGVITGTVTDNGTGNTTV